jgi:hypothetical protein
VVVKAKYDPENLFRLNPDITPRTTATGGGQRSHWSRFMPARPWVMARRTNVRSQRRQFLAGVIHGLRVVWPIISALLTIIMGLGIIVGRFEGWTLQESIYFSFVTGLTIGYGELVPKLLITRTLAILIGATGFLLTALIAAVAVKALERDDQDTG